MNNIDKATGQDDEGGGWLESKSLFKYLIYIFFSLLIVRRRFSVDSVCGVAWVGGGECTKVSATRTPKGIFNSSL